MDLDSQVNTLSLKVHSNMVQRAAKDWRISARTRPRKEPLGAPDYKNIIEKLQVQELWSSIETKIEGRTNGVKHTATCIILYIIYDYLMLYCCKNYSQAAFLSRVLVMEASISWCSYIDTLISILINEKSSCVTSTFLG